MINYAHDVAEHGYGALCFMIWMKMCHLYKMWWWDLLMIMGTTRLSIFFDFLILRRSVNGFSTYVFYFPSPKSPWFSFESISGFGFNLPRCSDLTIPRYYILRHRSVYFIPCFDLSFLFLYRKEEDQNIKYNDMAMFWLLCQGHRWVFVFFVT